MIAQLRPDIATATEQTVLNLKELETRISLLKNDLAWLAQGIGHAEAARIAASPGPNVATPFGAVGVGAFGSPLAFQGFTGQSIASQAIAANSAASPAFQQAYAAGLAQGIAQGQSLAQGLIASQFAASPYASLPFASFASPYAPIAQASAFPAFASGIPAHLATSAFGNGLGTFPAANSTPISLASAAFR
jgi:hypothetical protein